MNKLNIYNLVSSGMYFGNYYYYVLNRADLKRKEIDMISESVMCL